MRNLGGGKRKRGTRGDGAAAGRALEARRRDRSTARGAAQPAAFGGTRSARTARVSEAEGARGRGLEGGRGPKGRA